MLVLRNLLYWVGFLLLTPPYSLLAILMLPFPRVLRHRVVTTWTHLMLAWLRLIALRVGLGRIKGGVFVLVLGFGHGVLQGERFTSGQV